MKYKMFIDDERSPVDSSYTIVRNIHDFKILISNRGMPFEISFDHDLGDDEPTGFDIAKLIVENHLNGILTIPPDFKFYVHSQNPVGKQNIENLLNSFLEFID